jgi:hypothetical protein
MSNFIDLLSLLPSEIDAKDGTSVRGDSEPPQLDVGWFQEYFQYY